MKIKFIPQNIEVDIDPNKSVMRIAHENDLPVKSVCNGLPSCAECRIHIEEGEHNVLPPTPEELELIGTGYFVDRRRLSCQLKCFGDVVIDLSEQVEKEKLNSMKRPQGFIKKDESEVSLAVTGNLIDADAELLSDKETDFNENEIQDDEDVQALKNNNKKKNNRNRSRRNNNQKAKRADGEGSSQKPRQNKKKGKRPNKKRRPRNRNRDRHKSESKD